MRLTAQHDYHSTPVRLAILPPKRISRKETVKLVCQNCGNVFKMDSVGGTAGGCNPMNIQYTAADGKITVNTADLDSHAKQFSSWSGPVE